MQRDKLLLRVREYDRSDCYSLFRMILEAEIEELREGNDSAKPEDVLRNQGAISCLKKILKFTAPKAEVDKPVYDGGFN